MRSSSSLLSPPSSPPPAPLPLSSHSFSSMTCCPELDLSVTMSPDPKAGNTRSQQSDRPQLKPPPRGQTPRPHITLQGEAPPQQPIRGQRRSRGRHHGPRQWVDPPATPSSQDLGCLENAELNTTLALKAELESLKGAEFNSQKAIQETLLRSERTKNLINTKATEVVNVSRSELLFHSLVSVDVQEDQLISQVLQDRLQLAPPHRFHGNKATDCPSLLLFMTSDLLRQKPLPTEEEPLIYKPHPQIRPAYSTFDLYRRWTRCEATP